MNTNKQIKNDVVKEITEKLAAAQAVVVAKYDGLTVSEFQDLRKQLREKNVELKVYKNRLFKIAAKGAGLDGIEVALTGANVFAFGMSDDISPAKILASFAKEHQSLELKAGTYEGKVIDAVGVNEVATLPTLEEALTILAMQLLSPIKFIGVGLHQLTEGDYLSANESEAATEEVKAEETKETPAEEVKVEAPAEEAKAEETKKTPAKADVKEGE